MRGNLEANKIGQEKQTKFCSKNIRRWQTHHVRAFGRLPPLILVARWMVKGRGPELTVELPRSPEKPEMGTREEPVTNCRSLARFSMSISSTTCKSVTSLISSRSCLSWSNLTVYDPETWMKMTKTRLEAALTLQNHLTMLESWLQFLRRVFALQSSTSTWPSPQTISSSSFSSNASGGSNMTSRCVYKIVCSQKGVTVSCIVVGVVRRRASLGATYQLGDFWVQLRRSPSVGHQPADHTRSSASIPRTGLRIPSCCPPLLSG